MNAFVILLGIWDQLSRRCIHVSQGPCISGANDTHRKKDTMSTINNKRKTSDDPKKDVPNNMFWVVLRIGGHSI